MRSFVIIGMVVGLLVMGGCAKPENENATSQENGRSTQEISPLSVLAPRADDQWQQGESYRIRWSGGPQKVSLFFKDTALAEQGASVSITERITNIENEGVYKYAVPSDLNPGWYRWCISASNEPNEICSETFEVIAAPIPADSETDS